MILKILLPPGLDEDGRDRVVIGLIKKFHRRKSTTTGYALDVYPGERDWVDQPGNTDPKRRVYYAYIKQH